MTKPDNATTPAGGSPLDGGVRRLVPKRANARTLPCPDPVQGKRCPLCGGEYVCLESWRKKT